MESHNGIENNNNFLLEYVVRAPSDTSQNIETEAAAKISSA